MTDKFPDRLSDVLRDLDSPRGLLSAQSKLQCFDLELLSVGERQTLILAIKKAALLRGGPLLVLSLPPHIQAEMSMFGGEKIPGVDRTAYKRATPDQIVRRLTTGSMSEAQREDIVSGCDFKSFKKAHWQAYFSKCEVPIAAAKNFLAKDEAHGGFSDEEITQLALRNPAVVACISVDRLAPNTVVALLISGRAPDLWQTYDFNRLCKNHWRELFLHTNPEALPAASRPFIENKDGKGFSSDELLAMARKCHALISSLDPNKVPFNIAYELYLTGKADLLWKNFPFASLDKAEWRRILANPDVKIPPLFLEIAKSGRFKAEELCQLALKNDRICPILVDLNLSPDLIVDVLTNSKAEYVWEHYRFGQFSVENWERLIFGLKVDDVLRPRAMAALKCCKGITEEFSSKVLSRNTSYAPNLPISSIAPNVAVDILLRGKGYFLWSAYPFDRLNDDQWLRLLSGTTEPLSEQAIKFLRERSGEVDPARLESLLLQRGNLVEHVDAGFISPRVAFEILSRHPEHELWERYDFSRFDSLSLRVIVTATERKTNWPRSFVDCFCVSGRPFDVGDLLSIEAEKPGLVISLISTKWIDTLDDDLFAKLIKVSLRSDDGYDAIRKRFDSSDNSWKALSVGKLKALLAAAPLLRLCIDWTSWAYEDILDLVRIDPVFEKEFDHPVRFFVWRHFKSFLAMGALTAAAVMAICAQNQELASREVQRQRLNGIVQNIKRLDGSRDYKKLDEFWCSLASDDRVIVEPDLFVKRARGNLTDWQADCETIESGMRQLRELAKTGWGGAPENDVNSLIKELEASHVDRYAEAAEFRKLKSAHVEYRREEAERLRIESLRVKLREINNGILDCDDMARLAAWKLFVAKVVEESKLADEASKVYDRLRIRIDSVQAKIDAERVAKEVQSISNAVASVAVEMRASSALKDFDSWSGKFNAIAEMPGFDRYSAMPDYVAYNALADDFRLFSNLKDTVGSNLSEARRLDEKFQREFMTVDGGMECSNVVSSCELVLASAKSKNWPSLSEASQRVIDLMDIVNARDKRCWSLVDKLNDATDYASYYSASTRLIRDFGQFSQLRHLSGLCNLEPADLNRSYKISSRYTWGGDKSYKYHFVGMISLKPHDPSKTSVNVVPNTTTYSADLYTLRKNATGDVVATKFITQQGQGKFYKVSNVDYSGKQGVPLFVRSEHYTRKGE